MKYVIAALLLALSSSTFAQVIKHPSNEECMRYAVYRESRGGSLQQMKAVKDVINNRAAVYKQSICQVVKAKGQFPYFVHGVKRVKDKNFLTAYANASKLPPQFDTSFLFFNTKKFKWCGKTRKIDKMYFCKIKEV